MNRERSAHWFYDTQIEVVTSEIVEHFVVIQQLSGYIEYVVHEDN